MPVRQPFTRLDAIIDPPFAGHPAAVCLLPSARGGLARGTTAGGTP